MEKLPYISSKPQSQVLEALRGQTKWVRLNRDNQYHVKITTEGGGLIGIEDLKENREWATLFNHVLLTNRLAVFLARESRDKGIDVNINLVANAVLADHVARRKYEEARKYGKLFDADEIKNRTKDGAHALPLTEKILREANVSDEIIDLVKKSDVEYQDPYEVATTVEQKIFIYADLRATQKVISLDERFADLELRGRVESIDNLIRLKQWTYEVEEELFSYLDISPKDISDDYPRMTLTEAYLRRLYIQDIEDELFDDPYGWKGREDIEYPEDTWWGSYVRTLFEVQKRSSIPYICYEPIGIARAIEYFKSRE